MSWTRPARRRHRRIALATTAASLAAAVASTRGAGPVSATPAPLVTSDGVGLRFDENAVPDATIELLETELQPVVDQAIYEAALKHSVIDDPDWVDASSNIELALDFLPAGTFIHPDGGLELHVDLDNVLMRFYRYGSWWEPECLIEVLPDPGTIDAGAAIDPTPLPSPPLAMGPVAATWDASPSIGVAPGYSSLCTTTILPGWSTDLWGPGTDVADQIEAEVAAAAEALFADLWDENVTPLLDSLDEFGIAFGQVRTDDHGLIVTADLDATNGLSVPGMGGPFSVATAEDAGVTSSVTALLSNRANDVIVSIHPNVVNQHLTALYAATGGLWADDDLPPSIEATLFGGPNPTYRDDGYEYELTIGSEPVVAPTGSGGAPRLAIATTTLVITHEDVSGPIATLQGSVDGIALTTAVRAGVWAPDFDPSAMSASMTITPGVPGVTASAAALLPTTKTAFATWNTGTFVPFVDMAPSSIGGGPDYDLCTSCGRYAGDQRYTETFTVS